MAAVRPECVAPPGAWRGQPQEAGNGTAVRPECLAPPGAWGADQASCGTARTALSARGCCIGSAEAAQRGRPGGVVSRAKVEVALQPYVTGLQPRASQAATLRPCSEHCKHVQSTARHVHCERVQMGMAWAQRGHSVGTACACTWAMRMAACGSSMPHPSYSRHSSASLSPTMSSTYHAHAVDMQCACTCSAYAVHMQCTCSAHAVHMPCACGEGAPAAAG